MVIEGLSVVEGSGIGGSSYQPQAGDSPDVELGYKATALAADFGKRLMPLTLCPKRLTGHLKERDMYLGRSVHEDSVLLLSGAVDQCWLLQNGEVVRQAHLI